MAFIGENQVRNVYVIGTSTNATMTAVKAGANLNGAVIESDGTAAVAGQEFAIAVKNNKGGITLSDVISPKRVSYAKSVAYKARTLRTDVISNIVPVAEKLYQVRITIAGYGSLSVEDEYTKSGFYKSKAGDSAEDIVDGLVISLSRNLSKDGIADGTFVNYVTNRGVAVSLPQNTVFSVTKAVTGGVKEVSTITVTTGATVAGTGKLLINGKIVDIPLAIGSVTVTGTAIANAINAYGGFVAVNAAGVVTVTTSNERNDVNIGAFNGNGTGAVATAVTTTDGVDGTPTLTIQEKSTYLAEYYVTGKKDKLYLDYTVSVAFPGEAKVVTTEGSIGSGSGYQARNIEYYLLGNRQDSFRTMGFPHNFEAEYDTKLNGTYTMIELGYWDEGRDDPMKSKKQITVLCESSAAANTLIGQLNTVLGAGTVATV